jgi:hypothetical protein
MAIQCTNCGTQPRSNAKFCHACGTPIATTSLPSTLPLGGPPPGAAPKPEPSPFAPPAPPPTPKLAAATEAIHAQTSYMPQTPQTYYAPPRPMLAVPPKKKSGRALKIILLTFALLAVVGMGAIWMGVRWARRAANDFRRELPVQLSMNKDDINEETLGVPPYPNAVAETPIIVSGNSSRGSGSFGTFRFTTKDDVDKVAEFYKEKLGEEAQVTDVSEGSNRTVTLNRNQENAHTSIVITEDGNKTQIIITNAVGKPNAPRNRRDAQQIEQRMKEEADRLKQEAERIQREIERGIERNVPPPPPPLPKR